MSNKKVKIGIIGKGFIAGTKYLPALKRIPNNEVVAVCSKHSPEAFARKWNIKKTYTDMEDICKDQDVEVVLVAVPNYLHKKAAILAAENNKHVICTKPLAMNADEAFEMLKAVKRAGVIHGYAENHIFMPPILKAKELVSDENALGEIYWTRSAEKHLGPHSAWFWDPTKAGGGALIDIGCHLIEFGRTFIGKEQNPTEAFCWGDTLVHKIKAEDTAVGFIKHGGGQINQIEVAWGSRGGMGRAYEIFGKEGTIIISSEPLLKCFTTRGVKYAGEKTEATKGWLSIAFDEEWSMGFIGEFAHFINCVLEDTEPIENFRDGYIVNAIMDTLYLSMKSGKWEKIKSNKLNEIEKIKGII